jgi:TPR repeat protein
MYSRGIGTAQNYGKAFECWRRAADGGETVAMYNIANSYSLGRGVEKSDEKATEWMKKAADKGFINARLRYATFLSRAVGIREDAVDAVKLLKKICEDDKENLLMGQAEYQIAVAYEAGKLGEPKNKSLEHAREYFFKSHEKGQVESLVSYAVMLLEGQGGPVDVAKGIRCLEQAAEGSGLACLNMGLIFEAGDYRQSKNEDLALSFYVRGSRLMNYRCMYRAGSIWLRRAGELNGTDPVAALDLEGRAAAYMRLAAEQGDLAGALQNYGVWCQEGRYGVQRDRRRAETLFLRAAQTHDFKPSMLALGDLYAVDADGMPKDPVKSRYWCQKNGTEEALEKLAEMEMKWRGG